MPFFSRNKCKIGKKSKKKCEKDFPCYDKETKKCLNIFGAENPKNKRLLAKRRPILKKKSKKSGNSSIYESPMPVGSSLPMPVSSSPTGKPEQSSLVSESNIQNQEETSSMEVEHGSPKNGPTPQTPDYPISESNVSSPSWSK